MRRAAFAALPHSNQRVVAEALSCLASVVEAGRRETRCPPRWLGGSPFRSRGRHPYPLVPPLPVLSEITAGPPPFRGIGTLAEGAATARRHSTRVRDRAGP